MSFALALWPVNLKITPYKLYILYINKYMNIYYIRRNVNEKEHERNLDCGEQSSSLCSSLSSGFDFVEFTVKKKKNFFMILLRGIVSSVLFSLIPFLFLFSCFFCFVFFSRLYAKTNLLSAESSFTFFLHVKCIFFSLYIKGYVFIAI